MPQSLEVTGKTCDFYFCVKNAFVKTTQRGDEYLDLLLSDAKGEITAKLWDYSEALYGYIAAGVLVKVRGTVEMYNDKKQLRVAKIRPVNSTDAFDINDVIKSTPFDTGKLYDTVTSIIQNVKDENYRRITLTILEKFQEKIKIAPAAVRVHHAMRGGLLHHTLTVMRLCQAVCDIYPNLDRDLLLCGACLHDVAKTEEYVLTDAGVAGEYSLQGNLVGHLVMAAMQVRETAAQIGGDEEKTLLLEHMLLSHHGKPEHGAAVTPMLLEAEILSALDNLDATIFQIDQALSTVPKGGYTERLWSMDQRKYYAFDDHGEWVPNIE